MHPQLLLTTTSPSSGIDGKREDFAEKINLELGIGSSAFVNEGKEKKINQEKREPIFTNAQFHEFYQQIIVYNFISSFQFPLPNLMSVFNTFGPAIFNKYLSFTGSGSLNSDSTIMDDPEPGRCRRTDGRKWRCSKNVIPNQKYCERHMHRGRQGSRKHVEPIQSVSKPDNKISNSSNTIMPMVSISLAPSQQIDNGSGNSGSHSKDKDTGSEDGKNRNISGEKRRMDKNNHVDFIAARFVGLSPKSVLTCGSGKIELGSGNKNDVIETEIQRCRRTDGKKWQCKRHSIPNQKYCEMHMHRGVKRPMHNVPVTLASDRTAHSSRTMARNLDNRINLNTMPESPQPISVYNSSSSTSDATTITDENISISLM